MKRTWGGSVDGCGTFVNLVTAVVVGAGPAADPLSAADAATRRCRPADNGAADDARDVATAA